MEKITKVNVKEQFIDKKEKTQNYITALMMSLSFLGALGLVPAFAAGFDSQGTKILTALKELRKWVTIIGLGVAAVVFAINALKFGVGSERGSGAEGRAGMIKIIKTVVLLVCGVWIITAIVQFATGLGDNDINGNNSWK